MNKIAPSDDKMTTVVSASDAVALMATITRSGAAAISQSGDF